MVKLRMKVRVKLLCAFGLVLLLLVGVMGVYQYVSSHTTTNYENLLSQEMEIAHCADAIDTYMLQARRNEKDFIMRKDKKHLPQLRQNIASLKAEAETIANLAKQTGDQESVAIAKSILGYADEYENSFSQLVAAMEEQGLDEHSGLQGIFRDAAHKLSEDLKSHQIDELRIALFTMRSQEEDFIRTGSDEDRQHLNASIQDYKKLLQQSSAEEDFKNSQERLLASYEQAFNMYLEAYRASGPSEQYHQDMMTAGRELAGSISEILVPDSRWLLLDIRKNEKDYLLRHDERYVQKTHEAIARLEAAVTEAGVLPEHVKAVTSLLNTYQKAFDHLVEEDRIIDALTEEMRSAIHKVEPAVEELDRHAEEDRDLKIDSINQESRFYSKIAIGAGVAAIFLGFVLALWMSEIIVRPLQRISRSLKNISRGEGDLTQRLQLDCPTCSELKHCDKTSCKSYGIQNMCWEVSGPLSENPDCQVKDGSISNCEECIVYKRTNYDELQELSTNFNGFIFKLQRMFKEVVEGVVTISSATTELSTIAEQMSGGADSVSNQANTVATASEEMSVNMNSVAAATEQTTTNMNIVASAAEELTATIAEVNQNTDQASKVTGEAVEEARSATTKVQQLGHAAQEISKVTEVITKISGQTNLLALNATIEAARAGEAGKGFAVVANEIKELANQTAAATGQIKSQIEEIQDSTADTVSQIERITTVINNVNEKVTTIINAVKEQSSATNEIASNVSQAAEGLAEVNDKVAQSSEVSSQIAQDIAGVSQAATEMAASSDEVQSSTSDLSQTAEKLKDMVSGFKL